MANHQNPQSRQAQSVADEKTVTIYGMTVGELVRQGQKDIQAVKDQVAQREGVIVEKDKVIAQLKADLEAAKKRPEYTDEQVRRGLLAIAQDRGMQTLPDGSVRLMVTVPSEAAQAFKDWAESAGEPAATYIGRQVEEALLAYSMS